jgi:hypothetical protein
MTGFPVKDSASLSLYTLHTNAILNQARCYQSTSPLPSQQQQHPQLSRERLVAIIEQALQIIDDDDDDDDVSDSATTVVEDSEEEKDEKPSSSSPNNGRTRQ